MPCTVCQHPQRRDIDQALITGSATLATLSQEYGLSTSALHRHKVHLQANVNRAKGKLQDNLRQGCFFWLSQALEMAMQTAKAAQAEGNGKLVLQAIRQGTRLLNIILKQDFQLDDRVVYEILASPQWSTQASLLPPDPNIMSMSRQSLAEAISSSCPETATASRSPNPLEDLDLFKENALSLAQPTAKGKRQKANDLLTENRLFRPRAKGGKLPGKTPFRQDNNQDFQQDKLWEKIAGMVELPLPLQNLPLGTPNPKLEALFQPEENPGKLPGDKPLSEYIYEQSLLDNQCGKSPGTDLAI